jgi:hypothetical protein
MEKKKTSIHFSADDNKRLAWLRKHLGGIGQGAVITIALQRLQAAERAAARNMTNPFIEQIQAKSTIPFIQNVTVPEEQK